MNDMSRFFPDLSCGRPNCNSLTGGECECKPLQSSINTVAIVEPDELRPLQFKSEDLTSPRAGFFSSAFHRVEKLKLDRDLQRLETSYFKNNPSPAGQHERADIARLVQRCKSPTRTKQVNANARNEAQIERFERHIQIKRGEVKPTKLELEMGRAVLQRTLVQDVGMCTDSFGKIENVGFDKETGEVINVDKTLKTAIARISYREWSDEYRIRVEAQGRVGTPPPQQGGERSTKALTSRGARSILESGAYLSADRGGYTTFLTLTFDNEARERITSGSSTIGKECSRFFDVLSKMYQRGWSTDNPILKSQNGFDCVGASEVIPASGEKLDYLWVAEAPTNKDGDVNPHCHVLLRWKVEPYLFHDWAQRIEKNWGQGFAKLERIKQSDAASGYLLKALGYLTKGEASEQGVISGNRYNISKSARAPAWENIGNYHAQHMAAIIGEVKEKWARQDAPIKGQIADLNKQAFKLKDKYQGKAKGISKKIKALEEQIKSKYEELRARPARIADYQVTLKGAGALEKFIDWAAGARLWEGVEVENPYIPNRVPSGLWVRGITQARRRFKYLIPKLEEAAASWSGWLSDIRYFSTKEPQDTMMSDYMEYLSCKAA